jgi:hypothetical protein
MVLILPTTSCVVQLTEWVIYIKRNSFSIWFIVF